MAVSVASSVVTGNQSTPGSMDIAGANRLLIAKLRLMLDDNDMDFAIFATPTHPVGCLIWLVVLVILAFVIYDNKKECAEMSCESGQTAQLLNHQCLCVTPAKPKTEAMTPTEGLDSHSGE